MGYLDDIASDMSVFHRVDDIRALSARTLFAMIPRLPAYRGVLRHRAEQEMQEMQQGPDGSGSPAAASPAPGVPRGWAHLDPHVQRHLMAQSGPLADPDTVGRAVAKVPGVQMWGEVRKVTPNA